MRLRAMGTATTRDLAETSDFDMITVADVNLEAAAKLCNELGGGRLQPLAVDVTNLGDRFHVLCISVVVRGVAIPVAWKVLLGGMKDPWNPHWQDLAESWGCPMALPGERMSDVESRLASMWRPAEMAARKGGRGGGT